MPAYGAWLYDHLPEMTRWRDTEEGEDALKGLCDVLGSAFDGVRTDVDGFINLVNPDLCPVAFLPQLAALFGFEFPFDMSEDTQRSFIRNAVVLFRRKGTTEAMTQAVSRLVGSQYQVVVTAEDWQAHTLDVALVSPESGINSGVSQLEAKILYFVQLFTPAGLIPTLGLLYFGDETWGTTPTESLSSKELVPWSLNREGHQINSEPQAGFVYGVNGSGEVVLAGI